MIEVLLIAVCTCRRSEIGSSGTRGGGSVCLRGRQYTNRRCTDPAAGQGGTIAPPMIKSLVRTFRGPSRDPRMAYISRPMPRDLRDEDVVAALELALATDANPGYLVETLPAALKQVTGRDLQVMDRSVRDVTGAFSRVQVMIRDGDVGRWPGYDAMSYPLLAPPAKVEETRAAIVAADASGDESEAPPGPKPGWEPPPPVRR